MFVELKQKLGFDVIVRLFIFHLFSLNSYKLIKSQYLHGTFEKNASLNLEVYKIHNIKKDFVTEKYYFVAFGMQVCGYFNLKNIKYNSFFIRNFRINCFIM